MVTAYSNSAPPIPPRDHSISGCDFFWSVANNRRKAAALRHAHPHRKSPALQNRPRYHARRRAGLLLARGMDYAGLGDPERIFMEEGVSLAPMACGEAPPTGVDAGAVTILPTASARDLERGDLAGVVAPGGHADDDAGAASALDKVINTAHAEGLPVMAFGDAVPQALRSLGYAPPQDLPSCVLLHGGVRILETADDVRDAVRSFHQAGTAAAA
jgi:hypothetical protein